MFSCIYLVIAFRRNVTGMGYGSVPRKLTLLKVPRLPDQQAGTKRVTFGEA